MRSKILINAIDPEECRIAKVVDNRLEEFQIESAGREILHGNIYKAVITYVEASLQAAFVDFGSERNGFLQQQEIHSDYHRDTPDGKRTITHLVQKGQEVIVQVVKDPIQKKGAMLTTFISLPGRYIVLMPGSRSRGVSRKIEDEAERQRLKELMAGLDMPEGYGMITRTAGQGVTKAQLKKDVSYLLRLWRNIIHKGKSQKAPALLYKDRSLAVRAIRDYFTQDVDEIIIDNETVFQEVKNFVKIISPRHQQIVKHYTSDKPVFSKFELENQIASIFENRVPLKSGGSVVIEQTEALVSIDVNSGRSTQHKAIEQTALTTNLEAAEEIARQLRLRDMGGLIVIDFIDMREPKNRTAVERALREFVKRDKARLRVGRISQFGLLELARQRVAPSIDFGSLITCPHCEGKGMVPSTETLALRFLRKLKTQCRKNGLGAVRAVVPKAVADYVQNKKRREIVELETRHGLSLIIESDDGLQPHQCRIECEPSP